MADQQAKPRTFNPSALPSEARGLSLRAKLTIAMLVLALASLGVVAGLVFNRVEQVVLRQVAVDSEAARERARQISEEVERVNQSSYLLAAAQLIPPARRRNGATRRLPAQRAEQLRRDQPDHADRSGVLDDPGLGALASTPAPAPTCRSLAKNGEFTTGLGWSDTKQAQYRVFTPVKAQNRVQFVLELDADFRSLVGLSVAARQRRRS